MSDPYSLVLLTPIVVFVGGVILAGRRKQRERLSGMTREELIRDYNAHARQRNLQRQQETRHL